MTTLCLVRHGETNYNVQGRLQGREDIELNERGLNQAVECAKYFIKGEWDVIFTSPLKRAIKTALIIGEKIGIEKINEIEDLIERDYGLASGLLPDERRARFPDGNIIGQEDWINLRNRAMSCLNDIVSKNRNRRVIAVTHGGLINSVLTTLSNGEIGSGKTKLKNCCINILTFKEGKYEIEMYNYVAGENE